MPSLVSVKTSPNAPSFQILVPAGDWQSQQSRVRVDQIPAWSPPPQGAYKLNCDASFDQDLKRSGVGFVIRDHLSRSCVAVSSPVVFEDILVGEALEIWEGLLEDVSEGTLSIVVESDNQTIISYLLDPSKSPDLRILPILEDIRHISSYLDDCIFSFVPRSVNSIADSLARRALSVSGRMATTGNFATGRLLGEGTVGRVYRTKYADGKIGTSNVPVEFVTQHMDLIIDMKNLLESIHWKVSSYGLIWTNMICRTEA
ncbi:uncharacterized protein LOC122659356 [Telopea speciosissima]|uniref:uncharacterized protein LOC122659356 n=1 Tax=Telopea speciosissima TaxID=54955 RepID=UPI001CC409AE|nr:uncharacterized protein LOC122659356 [Telopea speciosissima]